MSDLTPNKGSESNGFKLLAIRALGRTPDYALKGLKVDTLYKFYQNYSFTGPSGYNVEGSDKVISIVCTGGIPNQLYSNNKPYVNISAVVGKNGSGKSSLNELIYLLNFLIASSDDLEMIKETDPLTLEYFSKIERPHIYKDIKTLKHLFKDSNIDLFYELSGLFYRMSYNCGIVEKESLLPQSEMIDFQETLSERIKKRKKLLSNFPYTVAINYSLYGLHGGTDMWLNPLFHKNDGYQIPIVINPYRKDGGIDVNSERHLAQSRLLSNISNLLNTAPIIVSKKKIEKIELLIVPEDFDSIWSVSMKSIIEKLTQKNKLDMFSFFNQISKSITGEVLLDAQSISELEIFQNELMRDKASKFIREKYDSVIPPSQIKYFLVKYVVRKVFKICIQQQEYRIKFLVNDLTKNNNNPFSLKNLNELGKALAEDKSHVTLKLKQALYSIKGNCFFENWKCTSNPNNREHIAFYTSVLFSTYKNAVEQIQQKNLSLNKESLEAIPNAMFKPTLQVTDSELQGIESPFDKLSSGEQQYIHTFQTAIYHLRNLNSVHDCGDETKIAYKYVNLIFDEIELCFHPEFQRTFINELLNGIKQAKLTNIESLNILFSTHSPFILSDIPSQNILRLTDGTPDERGVGRTTFGANIHDLLANDFFLDGFIGTFAKNKINSVIDYLKSSFEKTAEWDKESALRFIDVIGENLIKETLLEIYYTKFQDKLEEKILALNRLRNEK